MCFAKLKQMFHRSKTKSPPVARKLSKQEQKEERIERKVVTSRGGPNMPKRQPCPVCGSWVKRDRKTVGGAYYVCPNDGEFFVRR